ncbi:MAG: DNA cytosine methyltransferase [Candidatus Gastranaerophilales bacterium]|nr:DNA cytosine methyltransferase [Candidatus Gastranaerophilales bacterium]
MNVIDLFAGAGGFSQGFIKAGFKIVCAVEFDKSIAKTYSSNHPNVKVFVDDIKKIVQTPSFNQMFSDIIIGGPPCQGFSMAGARIRKDFISDERNYLFKYYLKTVSEKKPKVFVMENVPGLLTMSKGKILNEIIISFNKIGYNLYYKTLNSSNFGIPQNRERVVFFGVLNKKIDLDSIFKLTETKIETKYPLFFKRAYVHDALFGLNEPNENGKVILCKNKKYPEYLKGIISSDFITYNHTQTNHSQVAISRMNKIKQGQNWQVLNENIKSVHSGSYGRLDYKDIAPTITTRFDTPSGGRFIHPIKNRTITPREAARIQSFSDSFVFYGKKTSICKQIGNAVPPKMAFFIARVVKEILKI